MTMYITINIYIYICMYVEMSWMNILMIVGFNLLSHKYSSIYCFNLTILKELDGSTDDLSPWGQEWAVRHEQNHEANGGSRCRQRCIVAGAHRRGSSSLDSPVTGSFHLSKRCHCRWFKCRPWRNSISGWFSDESPCIAFRHISTHQKQISVGNTHSPTELLKPGPQCLAYAGGGADFRDFQLHWFPSGNQRWQWEITEKICL